MFKSWTIMMQNCTDSFQLLEISISDSEVLTDREIGVTLSFSRFLSTLFSSFYHIFCSKGGNKPFPSSFHKIIIPKALFRPHCMFPVIPKHCALKDLNRNYIIKPKVSIKEEAEHIVDLWLQAIAHIYMFACSQLCVHAWPFEWKCVCVCVGEAIGSYCDSCESGEQKAWKTLNCVLLESFNHW